MPTVRTRPPTRFQWWAVICAVLAFGGGAHADPFLNLTDAFADTKQILANNGTANIVVLGDSLTYQVNSYLPHFRELMQNRYGNAGAGYKGFSLWTGAGFNDMGWDKTGLDIDKEPHHSLDGLWDASNDEPSWITGNSNEAVYNLDVSSDRVEFHYIKKPNGGRFNLTQWNGNSGNYLTQIDTFSNDRFVETYGYTFPPGTHRKFMITPMGDGWATILGANNIIDAPGVRIHRGANGGWGIDNFLHRNYSFDDQLQLLDTDLVMVWIGQNDQTTHFQYQYEPKLRQLVNRLKTTLPDAEIVLISSWNSATTMQRISDAMEAVAAQESVGFINIFETAGDRDFFESNNYLKDNIHFGHWGGQYIGQLLFDAFETNGASLTPEPATLTLTIGGILMLLRRPLRRQRQAG